MATLKGEHALHAPTFPNATSVSPLNNAARPTAPSSYVGLSRQGPTMLELPDMSEKLPSIS